MGNRSSKKREKRSEKQASTRCQYVNYNTHSFVRCKHYKSHGSEFCELHKHPAKVVPNTKSNVHSQQQINQDFIIYNMMATNMPFDCHHDKPLHDNHQSHCVSTNHDHGLSHTNHNYGLSHTNHDYGLSHTNHDYGLSHTNHDCGSTQMTYDHGSSNFGGGF